MLEQPAVKEPSTMSLEDWLLQWTDKYAKSDWEQNTYKRARQIIINNINSIASHIPLNPLEPVHIKDVYIYLTEQGRKKKTGLSPRTLRYVHTILKQGLKEAVVLELIPRNPTENISHPKGKDKKAKRKWVVLDAEQLPKFFAGCKDPRDYTLIYTGARRSEFLALTWDDIL